MVQFPPFAGGEVAVRGGEVAVRGGEVEVRGGEVEVQGGEVEVQGGVRAQSADHLGDRRRQWGVVGEVVCVLGKTVSDMVCRSHANPL